jgi:two-component sensor histidine kinase
MNANSIPALLIAAACLTIAVSDAFAWARRDKRRVDIAFILVCLGGVSFCICCAGEYNVDSSARSVPWLKGETISSMAAGFALFWFIAEETRAIKRRHVIAYLAWTLLAIASQAIDLGELAWVASKPFTLRVDLPFGLEFVYREVERGPVLYVIDMVGFAMLVFLLIVVRGYRRSGHRRDSLVLSLGIGFIVAAQVLDFFIGIGVLRFVFVLEYAWLATILVMGLRRSNDFIETAIARRELRKTGLELKESQATLSTIMDSTADLIWSVDLESLGLLSCNSSFRAFFADRRGAAVAAGMGIEELFTAEEERLEVRACFARAAAEGTYTAELRLGGRACDRASARASAGAGARVAADAGTSGDARILSLSVNLLERDGKAFGLSAFARDITEHERAEERIRQSLAEKEVLIKEIYHRTKNNMNVIISILRLQAKEMDDERLKEAFDVAVSRIMSMSMAHDRLYEADDLSSIELKDYIEDLARSIMAGQARPVDPPTLRVEAEAARVMIDTAITCGLVLNELLTNSLKHAFPRGRQGAISVSLRREGPGQLRLTVSDDGVGPPPGFDAERDGHLGLRLIRRLAYSKFRTQPVFDAAGGFSCSLVFQDGAGA